MRIANTKGIELFNEGKGYIIGLGRGLIMVL